MKPKAATLKDKVINPVAMRTKEKKTKITNTRNERGNITTDPMDFKGQYRNTINNSVPTNLITR